MKGTGPSRHPSKKTATKCDKTLASEVVNTVENGENISRGKRDKKPCLELQICVD